MKITKDRAQTEIGHSNGVGREGIKQHYNRFCSNLSESGENPLKSCWVGSESIRVMRFRGTSVYPDMVDR